MLNKESTPCSTECNGGELRLRGFLISTPGELHCKDDHFGRLTLDEGSPTTDREKQVEKSLSV